MAIHPVIAAVTGRVRKCSLPTRQAYLARMTEAQGTGPVRKHLPCSNLAHACAAAGASGKAALPGSETVNMVLVPGEPVPTGLSNAEGGRRIRELFGDGKVGVDVPAQAEAGSFHAPSTCIFYGTANTNRVPNELTGALAAGADQGGGFLAAYPPRGVGAPAVSVEVLA